MGYLGVSLLPYYTWRQTHWLSATATSCSGPARPVTVAGKSGVMYKRATNSKYGRNLSAAASKKRRKGLLSHQFLWPMRRCQRRKSANRKSPRAHDGAIDTLVFRLGLYKLVRRSNPCETRSRRAALLNGPRLRGPRANCFHFEGRPFRIALARCYICAYL